jgi:hypothetical protein
MWLSLCLYWHWTLCSDGSIQSISVIFHGLLGHTAVMDVPLPFRILHYSLVKEYCIQVPPIPIICSQNVINNRPSYVLYFICSYSIIKLHFQVSELCHYFRLHLYKKHHQSHLWATKIVISCILKPDTNCQIRWYQLTWEWGRSGHVIGLKWLREARYERLHL